MRSSTLRDDRWEFLSEVVELADCGILLDVNNIYVSSQNHNFDPYDYQNNIPITAWVRFISPAIRSSRSTFSIRRSSCARPRVEYIRARNKKDRSHGDTHSNGTTVFPLLRKSTMKRSKLSSSRKSTSQPLLRRVGSRAELLHLQRAMAGAIFRPLTSRWRMQSQAKEGEMCVAKPPNSSNQTIA